MPLDRTARIPDQNARDIALVVLGEAGGEGQRGMAAVIHSMINRLEATYQNPQLAARNWGIPTSNQNPDLWDIAHAGNGTSNQYSALNPTANNGLREKLDAWERNNDPRIDRVADLVQKAWTNQGVPNEIGRA